MMSVVNPYTPIKVNEENGNLSAEVILRKIDFGADSLPTSIISDGEELLAAPVRIIGHEDGEDMVWSTLDRFIFARSEEELTVCGSMQSERFIINTAIKLGFDGCMTIDLKLMPRGMTVAQVFGLSDTKKAEYRIGDLTVEIPMKTSANLYHFNPNCSMYGEDGVLISRSYTSGSGELPAGKRYLPFRPIVWLGNEQRGLCFFSESDEHWQPADRSRAIEIVDKGDTRTLRLHLLDSHPKTWENVPKGKSPTYYYEPISFRFGLEATPVKPFPEKPFLHNALHIDCFRKIEGDYKEYLAGDFGGENGYDRMKRLGVTTLVLHEKWNKIQNYPYLSEPTAEQARVIIEECHKRGIKVIPYFGYELATLAPIWDERAPEALQLQAGKLTGGWWRVPPQRDYMVCYKSSWQDTFVDGIAKLMDDYGFDGLYLDGTVNLNGCTNALHGCGYTDEEGVRHPTYPIKEIRQLFRRLYEIVEPRGGIINYHSSICCNIPAMGFTHLGWNGESIQFKLVKDGASTIPLDYCRVEYIGRNMGIPQEFIAYENRPKWTFEQATAFAVIHGILPRPNSIEEPLDFIANIWKIYGDFDFVGAEWNPYWTQREIDTGDEDIKCSFYRETTGRRLMFVSNTTAEEKTLNLTAEAKCLFTTAGEGSVMPPYSFSVYMTSV